jgi:hypothetical protein
VRSSALVAVAFALPVLAATNASAGTAGSRHVTTAPAANRLHTQPGRVGLLPATSEFESSKAATNRGDNSRDGWYPDEPGLSPQVVGSSNFGQVFATHLNGQIYAQPLVVGHVLFVATETDWIYGLNPLTGAVEWSRHIGTAFRDASLHCADLTPSLGVTSTPTVDPATGIVYLVDQAYAAGKFGWFMHAVNPETGAEMPHFPVYIKGPAANNPLAPFAPTKQLQRPGLLFLGGVIYAAFGSHCDFLPYTGIVVGVSTKGRQTTMWTDEGAGKENGGGIWQAGGGLVSDGRNQILLATSNGFGSASHPVGQIAGSSPPANLADSVIRLVVQPDGSLKATSFFSMHDDTRLDSHDWDLAGAPVALPATFSTPKYPQLLVVTGKEGVVYLLNRAKLGGLDEGPGGKDLALGEYGPNGEAISTAGVWPGDGGYVYVATLASANGGAGRIDAYKFTTTSKGVPGLRLVGISSQTMVFGVSGPVVTSNGKASGSAVVWVITAEFLQAYDPVPVGGKLKLLGTWTVDGTDSFNPPGIGDNVVYVGNQFGVVYGFGLKSLPAVVRTRTKGVA